MHMFSYCSTYSQTSKGYRTDKFVGTDKKCYEEQRRMEQKKKKTHDKKETIYALSALKKMKQRIMKFVFSFETNLPQRNYLANT